MRIKINIISWGVFLVLISHMSDEKRPAKFNSEIKQIKMERVASKRPLRHQLPLFISDKT